MVWLSGLKQLWNSCLEERIGDLAHSPAQKQAQFHPTNIPSHVHRLFGFLLEAAGPPFDQPFTRSTSLPSSTVNFITPAF